VENQILNSLKAKKFKTKKNPVNIFPNISPNFRFWNVSVDTNYVFYTKLILDILLTNLANKLSKFLCFINIRQLMRDKIKLTHTLTIFIFNICVNILTHISAYISFNNFKIDNWWCNCFGFGTIFKPVHHNFPFIHCFLNRARFHLIFE